MALDLRSLRSFVAVASSGSISKAAESQYVAQPALSLQIKRIEAELGATLFQRHARGVILTDAGERFLTHAIDILRRVDSACADIRKAVSAPAGGVAVGMPQSMAQLLAVRLVSEVVARWPKVHLQLIELGSAYVPEDVLRGRIDFGLTFGIEPDARLHFQHVLDEELVLYASPHMLKDVLGPKGTAVKTLKLKELQSFPIILPTAAHSLRRRIDEYLAQEKLSLHIIAEVNTVPRLLELVKSNIAATILSRASADSTLGNDQLQAVQIVEPQMSRSVYFCKLATSPLSLAATAVYDRLYEMVEALSREGKWPSALKSNIDPL